MRIRTGLLSMGIVMALQFICVIFHMYDRWEWVDVPVHIAGGIAVGLVAGGILAYAKLRARPLWFSFLFTSAFVVFIACGWEIVEFIYHYYNGTLNIGGFSVRDMLGDLINGGIGGVITWYFFITRKLV